jgi:uncharacterized protein
MWRSLALASMIPDPLDRVFSDASMQRMLRTISCSYFQRAFLWCAPIGTLGGLIGLGGGEFRLPVLMHSMGFTAKTAISINLAVSAVTLTFALATRSGFVSVADVLPYGAEVIGLACGGMVTAFFAPPLVQKLTSETLVTIIALLLAAIGVLLWAEALVPFPDLELAANATTRFVLACLLGSGIGLVSSLLGVAGGELLIPTLIFIFGADIVTAGSASILISLCLIGIGLWRYWRLDAFPRGRGIQRITTAMASGSIIGATLGGIAVAVAPVEILKLLLGTVLLAAAAKTPLVRK